MHCTFFTQTESVSSSKYPLQTQHSFPCAIFTFKASGFPTKKQSKYQKCGSGHDSMGCCSFTLCRLLWKKKKKRSNIVDFNTWGQCPAWFSERLIGTAPRSLSCCFGALHRALSLGFALWLVSAETNKHHSSTWRHNNATLCLHMFVLDASRPVGLLGAGDGRHGSHPGPRLLQVAAGAERLRLDRDLLLPLVLEGLGLGWGRTIKGLKYLWNDNTGERTQMVQLNARTLCV